MDLQWIYKVFTFSDDEIFQHCGMSAIVYLRFLRLGFKLCCVGIFNSFYLIPSNLHGCKSNGDECSNLVDKVQQLSLGHVSQGGNNVWATTFAAYVIFGSAMYLIFHEFKWFTEYRHKFCIKPQPENYTVYVAHIPEEYRSDAKLLEYFRTIFSEEDVLEARIALNLTNLEKKVDARTSVLENLEHAVNIRDVKGDEPKHGNPIGGELPSIPTYSTELNSLNLDIAKRIEQIVDEGKQSVVLESDHNLSYLDGTEEGGPTDLAGIEANCLIQPNEDPELAQDTVGRQQGGREDGTKASSLRKKTFKKMKGAVVKSANIAQNLVSGSEDGKVRDAGFVTFSTLSAKNQCQQIIHHATPFTFSTMTAPRPEDIVWDNVGASHKQVMIGRLLAKVATAATCLFWTIPVSFFSSLSEVESLKELIPGLDGAIEKNPWLPGVLAQLSPLMLVIMTSLLPIILTVYCKKEGHIGNAELDASLLTKISAFMIIQIFFVQALSGSILAALNEIIEDWTKVVNLLATTVPQQVTSFIQYVQVRNFLGCSIELLRIARCAVAFLRKRVGPNLTEKERNKPWMGLLPMSEPEEIEYPLLFADMVLYFMINLVYSCIAPIMSYILLICFGVLSLVYRHQLIYTYSRKNDNGGTLWSSTIMLLISCMIISEITLMGVILLKEAFIPGVLLVPLIACSFLFLSYIKQQHFLVTENVPSNLCAQEDKVNYGKIDFKLLEDQYLQSALKSVYEFPDNISREDVEVFGTSQKEEDTSQKEEENEASN